MNTKDPNQELRLDKSQITVIAMVMALVRRPKNTEGVGDGSLIRVELAFLFIN